MMKLIIPYVAFFITNIVSVAFAANEDNAATSIEGVLWVFGLVGLIVLISGLVTRCPSCGKWWSRVSNGKRELNRKGSYKTVTRRDTQHNSKGETVGYSERQEQVHITTVSYENYYNCKHCKHNWTTVTNKEYEG